MNTYMYTKIIVNLLENRRVHNVLLIRSQHACDIRIVFQNAIGRHPLLITVHVRRYESNASASCSSAGIFSAVLVEAGTSLHAELKGRRDDVHKVGGAGEEDIETAVYLEFAVGEIGRVGAAAVGRTSGVREAGLKRAPCRRLFARAEA